MANQAAPGVVANSLVRYLLTQAGLAAGGLTAKGSDNQWQATLEAFGHKCAYTGADLTGTPAEKEHAIAMNRAAGGLHVYGNVIPATKKANAEKSGLRYDTFLRSKGDKFSSIAHLSDEEREAAIGRIEAFMHKARPDGLLDPHPELLAFYEAQYQKAKELCATAAGELQELLKKLNVAEVAAVEEAGDAVLDMPSPEQFELEERTTNNLPEKYQKIQERGNEMNIGSYARSVFAELFADGHIAEYLPSLTYREDTFYAVRLSFPAFVTQRQVDPIHYYATPYRHNGTDYYLCSQWYERNRDYLDSWLTETVFGQSGK